MKLETLSDFVTFATKKFKLSNIYFGHGTDNARDEAFYLILHVLRLAVRPSHLALKKRLTHCEKKKVLKIIDNRIKKQIPAAYLTKEAWFMGLPFYVDKRVLIPRSPLAELIENRFAPWINPKKKVIRILDIGTGSGCIAISAALTFPRAKVDAIDISSSALKVAAMNCTKHKVKRRVRLLKSDLFTKLTGKTYDIIISNPPYVGKLEMNCLPKEYYYEPAQALLAGQKGDEIVDRIIRDAVRYLSPKGILIVEVGNSAPLIMEKYPRLPFVWLDFECGDGEVFLLTREQLLGMCRS
jgi:ribosomal protein L3 glutamine methyltransferase